MASNASANGNVWAAMAYTPPRGPCNHRTALISSCPCLRFMLHPIKAATSFECDGCGHHASFHSLENKAEEAILQKWQQAKGVLEEDRTAPPNRKRKRITAKPVESVEVFEITDEA